MLFVLDASVALAWYLPAQANDYTRAAALAATSGDHAMIVPEVFGVEVAHNIVKAVRGRKLSTRLARDQLAELHSLPIETRPLGLSAVAQFNLAQNWFVSAFDAHYLALALDLGVALCSRDDKLNDAAARRGVVLFTP